MTIYFCGLDIAKDSFQAALVDDQGQLLWSRPFPMSSEGFSNFLDDLPPAPSSIKLGLESSGSYHLTLCSFLQAHHLDVRLLNPILIYNFSKLSLRKTKTDKRDASTIAEFLRTNIQTLPQPLPATDELRTLARERQNISAQIVSTKNEIKRYLNLLFPEILRLINPFTDASLRLLAAFPSKEAILQASPQAILNVLTNTARGRKSSLSPQLLRQLAQTSIGLSSENLETVLRSKIRLLHSLQQELKQITARLIHSCQTQFPDQFRILCSIPGLNQTTVSHFLAETNNRSFPSRQKLIAYAGLDPAIYQSGQWKGRGHISKRGNKSLRRVLFLMAVAVISVNPLFHSFYSKKRAEGKPYRQAVLAVAHKLIRIIHALLQHQTLFNPAFNSL
ncbi:MAG: IS110 family transposase [Candidatus Aminicenantes bacterium]|nr:IS110 family transposase [Candidatus Aminicenantes bacterium]